MAEKYFIEYNDTENIVHRLGISSTIFVGSTTEVNGSVFMDYASTSEAEESIRGKGVRVDLEATELLSFSDLYTEQERVWQVNYVRDGVTLFNGWLNSEGLFESFVTDRWILSLDCVDGLGFLDGLSYVDSSGLIFIGEQKQIDIISNCLNRTEIFQPINTNVDIYYTGLSTSLDILDNVFFNANRFVKDDGETIMSCDEVLRSVLEPYGAVITSFEGEWYIYKPNQIFSESDPVFFTYDSDGVSIPPTTKTFNIEFDLGSQIDGFSPHHCNENQTISNQRSIGAYRVNYKYGFIKSFIPNIFFQHNGVTIPDYTINSLQNIVLDPSGIGVRVFFNAFELPVPSARLTSSVSIIVALGDKLTYLIRFVTTLFIAGGGGLGLFKYRIILVGTSTYYYAKNSDIWTLTPTTNDIAGQGLDVSITTEVDAAPFPLPGSVRIEIWDARRSATEDGIFLLQEVSLSPTDTDKEIIQGEFHTVQRTVKPSSRVKDVVEVSNGDTPSDKYIGTIHKADEVTPTTTWFRKGITEALPLLQIMGEETMRLNASPMRIFSGDIYGYIPYLSVFTINNLAGKYMPISYSYDTKANIISLILKQIYGDELADLEYMQTFDFGETVKPTIKG